MNLTPRKLYFNEFSKTLGHRDLRYYSYYEQLSTEEELDVLFNLLIQGYGSRHTPVYRLCDAEYMYIIGRRLPKAKMSLLSKLSFLSKSLLINLNIINQKTWHGENYSVLEKKQLKEKYLNDLRKIAMDGFLAPHLLLSEGRFCEEFNEPIVSFFHSNNIRFDKENYFPFYFVYVILSLKRYKKVLFENKSVLIVTSFNERKLKTSFESELKKEGVKTVSFYEISANKSMLEVIDQSRLPEKADLVLIGAGIGSANIMNQLESLNAICIDAGHALDCFSKPELRKERICLYPDEMINA